MVGGGGKGATVRGRGYRSLPYDPGGCVLISLFPRNSDTGRRRSSARYHCERAIQAGVPRSFSTYSPFLFHFLSHSLPASFSDVLFFHIVIPSYSLATLILALSRLTCFGVSARLGEMLGIRALVLLLYYYVTWLPASFPFASMLRYEYRMEISVRHGERDPSYFELAKRKRVVESVSLFIPAGVTTRVYTPQERANWPRCGVSDAPVGSRYFAMLGAKIRGCEESTFSPWRREKKRDGCRRWESSLSFSRFSESRATPRMDGGIETEGRGGGWREERRSPAAMFLDRV